MEKTDSQIEYLIIYFIVSILTNINKNINFILLRLN